MPRPLILFIHITAAMGVFAAMGIEGVALLQLRRASSLAQLQAAVNGLRLMQRVMALSALTLVLSGLYLAGSGAHPGGGITGGPGANAVRKILKDL